MVQWLGVLALTGEGPGSIRGWGTNISQVTQWCPPTQKMVKIVIFMLHLATIKNLYHKNSIKRQLFRYY